MLTKFAAALLATSLIAGSAIAAQSSGTTGTNGTAPAVQTQAQSPAVKASKPVKHAARRRSHVRKHIARGKNHVVHHARHTTPAKTHQAGMGKGAKHS